MELSGVITTTAEAALLGSAWLVAVTCTIWAMYGRVGVPGGTPQAGAVYKPVEDMLPTEGLTDQVRAVLLVPETAAANCSLCDAMIVATEGAKLTITGVDTDEFSWPFLTERLGATGLVCFGSSAAVMTDVSTIETTIAIVVT